MRIDINYLCEEIHRAIRKHQTLTEGRQSKNRNSAKNYIMQQLGYSESDVMQFIGQLKVKIQSVRLQQEKFLLGVARLFIDGDLSANDDFKCTNFNQTLKLIASDAHVNEYDNNLNGMSADELINRFAQEMLDKGVPPEDIFEEIYDFHDGYAKVKLDYKYNFIDTNGKLISDTWFDWVDEFYNGYADVKLDGKFFKIDKNGQRISGM